MSSRTEVANSQDSEELQLSPHGPGADGQVAQDTWPAAATSRAAILDSQLTGGSQRTLNTDKL